jgi:hypothetical protein
LIRLKAASRGHAHSAAQRKAMPHIEKFDRAITRISRSRADGSPLSVSRLD